MNNQSALSQLAEQVLQNPILLRKLSEKVYELMLADIQNQRDRSGKYRR
ncbi:hypothetical protein [Scytonema hofmannii]|nr:hypothetical protein [Scytonema hofmannii]